jgi:ABC-type transporter Mla MlaB component
LAAPEPRSIVLLIGGPITRGDAPALCESARGLLEGSGAHILVCDVGALVHPDLAAVDVLARLQLVARRLGCRMVLQRASPELRELLAFAGLDDALPLRPALRLEPRREPEEREQRLGVEEEREAGDPAR